MAEGNTVTMATIHYVAIARCVYSQFIHAQAYSSAHPQLLSLQNQFTTLRSETHSLIKL